MTWGKIQRSSNACGNVVAIYNGRRRARGWWPHATSLAPGPPRGNPTQRAAAASQPLIAASRWGRAERGTPQGSASPPCPTAARAGISRFRGFGELTGIGRKGKMGGGGWVKDGGGRLCVQSLSWWEKSFFLAQNQAALALLQRRSCSTNQPPTRVGCKAKLVSPLLPPTLLTWTWSKTSGDGWGHGSRHVSVPWCFPQGPPKGSPSLEPPAGPTLPPAQDHDWHSPLLSQSFLAGAADLIFRM